ncbi:MAG: motility protein A [Rhodospirillaceae bacterium]
MNFSAFLGIALVGAMVWFAAATSGISPQALLSIPGLIIILGGTAAATLISFNWSTIRRAWRATWIIFTRSGRQTNRDVADLTALSRAWHRNSLAEMTQAIAATESPFLKMGAEMLTDSALPRAAVHHALQNHIERLRMRERAEAQVFRAMAGYAPAFGVMGTVFGLAQMFANVGSSNITAISTGLGTALLTTIYGVVLAYGLFRPFAARLEQRSEQRVRRMHLLRDALDLMAEKKSPSLTQEFMRAAEAELGDELGRTGPRRHA